MRYIITKYIKYIKYITYIKFNKIRIHKNINNSRKFLAGGGKEAVAKSPELPLLQASPCLPTATKYVYTITAPTLTYFVPSSRRNRIRTGRSAGFAFSHYRRFAGRKSHQHGHGKEMGHVAGVHHWPDQHVRPGDMRLDIQLRFRGPVPGQQLVADVRRLVHVPVAVAPVHSVLVLFVRFAVRFLHG